MAAAPDYEAKRSLGGVLHLWGPPAMTSLAQSWAKGFNRWQPGVKVEINFMGSDTAIPGLYSGQADIAFLGRENNVTDDNGFSRPMGYKPLRFEVTTGSLDVPGKSDALAVFVHRDNPLAKLSLAQLDALFGYERRRGAAGAVRTWGQLGLTGNWADQPIHLYGYDAATGTGQFFTHVVLHDSHKMSWDNFTEFKDGRNSDGTLFRAAEQSLAALRDDPLGLAVSSLRYASDDVKAVSLSAADEPAVAATRESLVSRAYPLTRVTYAFVNQPPGNPIDPKVREFLRYIFSREGQEDVARDRGYLPLNETILAAQRRLLE
jgi:phosphate transport system substrate-binding protein